MEGMIDKSIAGLMKKDPAILTEVIEKDEVQANETEITIEELCTAMISQYQSVAQDLRTILMVMKMNNDLERAGDHAVNIAEDVVYVVRGEDIRHKHA